MRWRVFVGVTLVCWSVACAGIFDSTVGGEIAVEDGTFGAWTVEPKACYSGERRGYMGVDLVGGDGLHRARLVEDPVEGAALVVWVPGTKRAAVLRPEQCSRFDGRLAPTNVKINDIQAIDGHIVVECATPDGVQVKGEVQFVRCH